MSEIAWIEAFGLLLVLLSSFFKLFFTEDLAALHRGVLQFRLEQKVDLLFMVLAHHHRRSHPDDSAIFSSALNLDGIFERWEMATGATRAGEQASAFRGIETYAFLLGSMMLVSAKVLPLIWPELFASSRLSGI